MNIKRNQMTLPGSISMANKSKSADFKLKANGIMVIKNGELIHKWHKKDEDFCYFDQEPMLLLSMKVKASTLSPTISIKKGNEP